MTTALHSPAAAGAAPGDPAPAPAAPASPTPVTMAAALNRALADCLAADERVVVFGEDVATLGGGFRVTDGLAARFGPGRGPPPPGRVFPRPPRPRPPLRAGPRLRHAAG